MALQGKRIKHLYNRIGFGLNLQEFQKIQTLDQAIDHCFKASQSIKHLETPGMNLPDRRRLATISREERQEMLRMNRNGIMILNKHWIDHMASTPAQLREKMTFFWHDHFACKLRNPEIAHIQNMTLRNFALDTYPELLHAIAKDPGMLLFLNNQQNKKDHPNENFARELLELFTLGRGHYTEKDVKEAARAFTGWSVMPDGSFFFRRGQHDEGKKEFLGKRGNFGGEDIIDIVLEQRQTARFITEKIYRYLVHHIPDPEVLETWSDYFYESGYHITSLLRKIFESDHFYADQHIGSRIKSPVEFLVGMMRLFHVHFGAPEGPVYIQKILGQILFLPPNISGWPEQRAWIDSSSMMARLSIPKIIFTTGALDIIPKAAFAGNEEMIKLQRLNEKLDVQIDWSELEQYIDTIPPNEHYSRLKEYILSVPFLAESGQHIQKISGHEDLVKVIIRFVASPEFQLC